MTLALNQMLWLDGVFLWTNRNSFNINVSELCIICNIQMAEILAARDREDGKNVSLL